MSKLIFSLITPLNISLAFVALMFSLPFVSMTHNLPITSFYTEWIAGMLGLLAAGFPLLSRSLSRINIPQISLIFIGLSIIVIAQLQAGILHSINHALLIISYLIWAFLLTILGSHLRNVLGLEKITTMLAFFLFIAGYINICIVTLQIIVHTGGVITFLPYLTSYGALAQPNHFATFCTLAIISAIYLYIKKKFSTGFLILTLISFLVMLALSGSRSALLYLTALLTLAFITHLITIRQNRESTETKNLLQINLITLPLFSIVILFIAYIAPDEIANLPTERLIANAPSNSHRLSIWRDSINLFFQSPWLGIGAGNMRAESFLMQDSSSKFLSMGIHENAHNLFLHLLTEFGVGAFLIVLAGLTVWLRAFKWRELNLDSWWLITLLAVLGIHSMLEYPLWYAYFLGIAAILLGAGDEKTLHPFNSKRSTRKFITSIKSTLIILLLIGITNLYTMLVANIKLESAIHQFSGLKSKEQQKDLEWVLDYSLLSPYAEVILAMSTIIDNNYLDSKIALNYSAIRFRPLSSLTYQQVVLLTLKGNNDEAMKLLTRCLEIYPTNTRYITEKLTPEQKKRFIEMVEKASPVLANSAYYQ